MKRRALMWCALGWFTLLALAALVVWEDFSRHTHHDCYPGDTMDIAKAASDLPEGTILMPSMVVIESVPTRFLPPNMIEERDLGLYVGERLSAGLEEGAMILDSDFTALRSSDHELCGEVPAHLDGELVSAHLSHPDGARVEIPALIFEDPGPEMLEGARAQKDSASADLERLGRVARNLLCNHEGWTIDVRALDL